VQNAAARADAGIGRPKTAKVEALCISDKKGVQKISILSAVFRADHGIEQDAHAGPWHRQVSLLAGKDIEFVRDTLPDIKPGDFAENVVICDIDLSPLGLGSRLRVGGDSGLGDLVWVPMVKSCGERLVLWTGAKHSGKTPAAMALAERARAAGFLPSPGCWRPRRCATRQTS